jgi:cell division protein FtsW
MLLLAIGLVMVLSASFARAYYESGNATYFFFRQLIFSVSGIALLMLFSRLKVATLRRWSFPLLIFSVFLLLAVLVIGVELNNAKRWISLGFTTFQPSEVAKLAVIMSFAVMSCVYSDKMKTFKYGVLPFAAVLAVICGLLVFEPHLSACVIIVSIGAIMMFAGGTKKFWFIIGLAAVALAGWIIVTRFPYASSRITTWLDPESDPTGDGWQIIQSLYSVGSGGLLGLGLGQGRQKYLYLPEEHNDFIFRSSVKSWGSWAQCSSLRCLLC